MDCTVAQVCVDKSVFPDGLFVVVTREREAGAAANGGDGIGGVEVVGSGVVGGVATATATAAAAAAATSSLFVRATDCDRCWSAPEVRAPLTTALDTYIDEVACALAGGKGEDEDSTPSSSPPPSTTFSDARGHSHAVSAELRGPEEGRRLDLVVSWWRRETGDQAKVRIQLKRERPEDEPGARRGVVSLALASARAAGAAAAELAAQNAELASMAERAQTSATGAESKWRAREGELFAKFAAVLNEKKAEAARWKRLAEASAGASAGAAGAAGVGVAGAAAAGAAAAGAAAAGAATGAAAPMSLTAAEGEGGRGPSASGVVGACAYGGGGGDPMLVEGATAAAAPAAAPAADGYLNNDDYDEDNVTTEEDEDRRSDSGGSRAVEEDEGFDDDDF